MPLEELSRARRTLLLLLDTKPLRSKDWSLISELEERKFARMIRSRDGREPSLPLNNIKNFTQFGLTKETLLPKKRKSRKENLPKLKSLKNKHQK
jgi:hypothetical protein